jgi:hypothetical protein
MITFTHKGDFSKTEKFFKGVITSDYVHVLEKYAKEGVIALAAATPMNTGETASSWGYELRHYPGGASITWTNSNVVDGVPIVILLQYGHATNSGGYVQGRDFINPALQPLFDKIAEDVWKEVIRL